MTQDNPFASPGVELIDAPAQPLPGPTPGLLRLFGWLTLTCIIGTLAALVMSVAGGILELPLLVTLEVWLNSLCALLSAYLLLRLKGLLQLRYGIAGLDAPVWLSIILSLLAQAIMVVSGDAMETFGWPMAAFFVGLFLIGGATLWLGLVLRRGIGEDALLRTLAWLYIVSGGMLLSIILGLLAFLPLLAAQFVGMLVFFRASNQSR